MRKKSLFETFWRFIIQYCVSDKMFHLENGRDSGHFYKNLVRVDKIVIGKII